MSSALEHRRFRRATLDAPVVIRTVEAEGAEPAIITGQAKNVSLAGLYCHVKSPCSLTAGQPVLSSIAFTDEQARLFPFARLLGKGWVTRVESVTAGKRAGEPAERDALIGVTVAFTPDLTALGMLESS